MLAGQSLEALNRGDRAEAKRIDEKAAALIYEYRSRFKNDPTFTQLDCELEFRRGDTTRALALTQEVDAQAKASPVGPLLRAQIFAAKNQPREAASAYAEPPRPEPETSTRPGSNWPGSASGTARPDEAIRQPDTSSTPTPTSRRASPPSS